MERERLYIGEDTQMATGASAGHEQSADRDTDTQVQNPELSKPLDGLSINGLRGRASGYQAMDEKVKLEAVRDEAVGRLSRIPSFFEDDRSKLEQMITEINIHLEKKDGQ